MKSLAALILFFIILLSVTSPADAPFVTIPQPPFYAAVFSWDRIPDPVVAGYRVHYGTNTGTYDHHIDAGTACRVVIGDFVEGATYYSAVTAYAADGRESEPSEEVPFIHTPGESVAVSLERSVDLKAWEPIMEFWCQPRHAEFFRALVLDIPQKTIQPAPVIVPEPVRIQPTTPRR